MSTIRGLLQTLIPKDPDMNPDLDTLATRLYVTIDDVLIDHPEWAPERPTVGIAPKALSVDHPSTGGAGQAVKNPSSVSACTAVDRADRSVR